MQQHEAILSTRISKFMQRQYPKVIYRFDIADLKLTKPQAIRMKALQGGLKGYPDMFLASAQKGHHGLYIELKKDYAQVYRKDGSYKKSEHLEHQISVHARLRDEGYMVVWGLGFEDTVKKIREYFEPVSKVHEKQGSLI